MKATVVVYIVVAAFFGLIVGWIIGSQQAITRSASAPPVAAAPGQQAAASAPAPKTVDESQANSLRTEAQQKPNDPKPRVSLGNLYYDAERYDEAVKWYEEALRLNPKDISVSTDLGVSYWGLNQPDRALQQFDHSLSLDPNHLTTLLDQGSVRAFGKQDLTGAVQSWEKVIKLSPSSDQGQSAKRLLDGLKQSHPELATPPASPAAK